MWLLKTIYLYDLDQQKEYQLTFYTYTEGKSGSAAYIDGNKVLYTEITAALGDIKGQIRLITLSP